MKKNLIIIAILLFFGNVSIGQMQGNLSEGASNYIVFKAKPMVNIANAGYSTIEYFVRYEKTKPEFTYGPVENNLTNFPGMTNWVVTKKFAQDATYFYDWFLYTAPSPITGLRSYTMGEEYEVIKVPVIGALVKDLGLTLVHREDENPYYYVFTNQIGEDNRPASLNQYFFPATAVAGSPGSRIYAQDIILPVNFLSFYALKNNDDAKLSWEVDGDKDNKYFEVLRSLNGRDFKSIEKINSLQNGQLVNSYEAQDYNLSKLGSGEVYYQIKQVDKDGQSTKSAVRLLSVDGLGKAVTAFPNPAKTSTKLVVDAPEAGKGNIIMRDAIGRQVQVINAQFNRGINQFNLNVMNLSSGDYNIQVSGGGIQETIKLTKIN